MKSHKLIAKFMIAAFVACIVGACTDLAKIEDRLDDLDSKVTALQAQISALNNNVETFKYLKDGAVITEIQEVSIMARMEQTEILRQSLSMIMDSGLSMVTFRLFKQQVLMA